MTQGLVSVVDHEGRVLFKLITGADGYLAQDVALRVMPILLAGGGVHELRRMAVHLGFGDEDGSFVIQDRERDWNGSGRDISADLPPAYRERFNDPLWNPRWALGTAEHAHVVHMPRPAAEPEDTSE